MGPPSKKYGSDVLVDVIKSLGIKYVTLNPGASVRGLHDSIVNYGRNKSPKMILCLHEEIAVAIASGYFRASNRPLLVLLHDIEGLLHAPRAIFDAWLEREAVLLVGGNGPADIEKRRPGIDWIHTALLPNFVVRSFVKWDDQPAGLSSAVESLLRAYGVATAKPEGPVYLSIDADLQESEVKGEFTVPNPRDYPPNLLGEGSLEALRETAKLLADASSPVLITGRYGRGDDSVNALVHLAQATGAAVLDNGLRFNFPSSHPQNLTGSEEDVLGEADVVLAIDVKDLYKEIVKEESHYTRRHKLLTRPDARLIRIDQEDIHPSSWVSEYGRLTPTALSITGDGPSAVRALSQMVDKTITSPSKRRQVKNRIESLEQRSRALRAGWLKKASAALKSSSITYPALSLIAWNGVKGRDWVLSFPGYTQAGINAWLRRVWEITRSYQYPGRSGATGVGIGRAIGNALANRGKLCIDFQPDGDLLYSPSALWTLASYKIPVLIIMLNNRSYYNDEAHQGAIAVERGRPVKNKGIGTRIENPNVDFAKLSKSYDVGGTGPVDSPDKLSSAMKAAVKVVLEEKKPFLIDALVQP